MPPPSPMSIFPEEFEQIQAICDGLNKQANAKAVFLVDKDGQLIAQAGETEGLDTTSLASLTAGTIAATGGLAQLIEEKEFAQQMHEGEKNNFYISIVGGRAILVVIFDSRSSLGLVRLRVRKCSESLTGIFETLVKKTAATAGESPFAEITDDDIDKLFAE